MKNRNIDIKLTWKTLSNFSNVLLKNKFPSFNVVLKYKEEVIDKFYDLNNHTIINSKNFSARNNSKKLKYNLIEEKNFINSNFNYTFEENYLKYKEKNNKLGFYKDIDISILYNNLDKQYFTFFVEYEMLKDIDKKLLFNKIYRSNDFLSIKILSNKKYVEDNGIYSYLIFSNLSNKTERNLSLENLFVEDIKSKWLDNNNSTSLLTIPFVESNLVETSENINIKILPLTKWQSDMYLFLSKRESEAALNGFLKENFKEQIINIGKIYKQSINYETLIFFQNYLYLFNVESIKRSEKEIKVGDIIFHNYYPILDKKNKTICLSEDINSDDVIDNEYNLPKDYLGYYDQNQNQYVDINLDLDYFQSRNIKNVNIFNIEENESECIMHIEFITDFFDNEKFYVGSNQNLKYIKKYKTQIEDKAYITFLFEYKYLLKKTKDFLELHKNVNKDQIISDRDLINFSAKLIM